MWLWFGKDLVEYIGRKFLWIYSRMCLRGGEGRGGDELSRKSMHWWGWVGGWRWGWWGGGGGWGCQPIKAVRSRVYPRGHLPTIMQNY